jgi:RHS repeat-associated protein
MPSSIKRAGALANEYRYTPWGSFEAGYPKEGTADNPLLYMGRELDWHTRLSYVRNRWYDPQLGRFPSEDPFGLSGGINPYVYAGNDPVNSTDPLGLCAQGYRRYGGTVAGLQVWFSCPRESNYRPGALIDVIPDEDPLIGLGGGGQLDVRGVSMRHSKSNCRGVDAFVCRELMLAIDFLQRHPIPICRTTGVSAQQRLLQGHYRYDALSPYVRGARAWTVLGAPEVFLAPLAFTGQPVITGLPFYLPGAVAEEEYHQLTGFAGHRKDGNFEGPSSALAPDQVGHSCVGALWVR